MYWYVEQERKTSNKTSKITMGKIGNMKHLVKRDHYTLLIITSELDGITNIIYIPQTM